MVKFYLKKSTAQAQRKKGERVVKRKQKSGRTVFKLKKVKK